MKLKIGRPLFVYFCSAMVLLLTLSSFGVFYYWSNGAANIENMTSVFDSTTSIDEISKMGGVEEVKTLVQNDKLRESITYFEGFSERIKAIHDIQETSAFNDLQAEMNTVNNTLNKMLTYSSKANLIDVLRAKVIAFENFVEHNNWRTLTRVSQSINAKISNGAIASPGFFTYSKMRGLHNSISNDVKYMDSVTTSSVLGQEDKNLIISRLKTLTTELDMIGNSLDSLSLFNSQYKKLSEVYESWIGTVKPMLTEKKLDVIKNSKVILYGMLGFIGSILLMFVGGYFVYLFTSKKQEKQVETVITDVIKDGLIPLNASLDGVWSQDFKEQLEKYREYVHKRMSFGSIFQDAMPFSSILLDSNLNLVWANALFYEHWKLGDKHKSSSNNLTWDFLQRSTNLGENDPVLEAVKENIAGIYQIQVKTQGAEETAPFEMYVSPVEYAGQKRIMVIFYPLRSLEETLGNQMKSLVSPVSRALDTLMEAKFNGDLKDKLHADFDAAGIEHIYKKFDKVNDYFINQKTGLMSEINEIENTLFEQYKQMDDIKIVLEGQKELQHDAIGKFSFAKENIVSVVDMRSQFEAMIVQIGNLTEKLFSEELSLLSKSSDVSELLQENTKAIDNLVRSRDEFKRLKSQVELHKTRVSNILEQSRNEESPTKVASGLQRLKSEMLEFDNVLTAFSKVTTSLDVGLSKIQIITKSKEMPNLSELKASFEELRRDIEVIQSQSSKMGRVGLEKDEELIKSLKGLYLSFQNLRVRSKEIDVIINQDEVGYQNQDRDIRAVNNDI